MSSAGGTDDAGDVGSVGVEAARLLAALQDWARESSSEYADATASAAAGAASAWTELNEHLATGGQDCTYCPVCRVVAAVRGTSPEVRAHLRTAASSLVEAAAGLLATSAPRPGTEHHDGSVERIDLTDDKWEDD